MAVLNPIVRLNIANAIEVVKCVAINVCAGNAGIKNLEETYNPP